ncbi:5-(carboxyamino)imidazole ribonucleotide mutase [Candidatus Daviesbacteria bacterium]|nr:5-(carboxyamino)imidazole ribonucleotide mutase [Candidatus Daviesbacteria bacterium]
MDNNEVLILTGSDSDLPKMEEAAKILKEFGVKFEMTISSAHRSPERTEELIEEAKSSGVKVIIVGAGMAAHLAGVIASRFPLPVIGVPLESGTLSGVDAFLSTLQMPPGMPVATMAINGARNAGILAVQILATSNPQLKEKLVAYKKRLAMEVEEKAVSLNKYGNK